MAEQLIQDFSETSTDKEQNFKRANKNKRKKRNKNKNNPNKEQTNTKSNQLLYPNYCSL